MPELEPTFVPFRGDFSGLRKDLRDSEREATEAGRRMGEGFSKGADEAGRATDGFVGKLRVAKDAALAFLLVIGSRMAAGLRGLGGLIARTTTAIIDFTALGMLAGARAARGLANELREADGALQHLAPVADVAAVSLEKVAKGILIVSGVVTGLQVAAATAFAALIVASGNAAAEVQGDWNAIRTIVTPGIEGLRELRGEVSKLAGDVGVEGPEAFQAFYQVLSALPQIASRPAAGLEVLRVALEQAGTGFTDVGTSVDALTTVLNAYNLEIEESERVSDLLFTTQNLGKTTVGELAASLGRVAPVASAAGVSLEELLAVVTTATLAGVDTAEVMTQLRQVISNLLKPAGEAKEAAAQLGIEFNAAALESKGLKAVIDEIFEAADGRTELLAQLFGSQEAVALLVLLRENAGQLDSALQGLTSSAGAHKRTVDTMNESWERQKEIFRGLIDNELRQIGFAFTSFGAGALGVVNTVLKGVRALSEEVEKLGTNPAFPLAAAGFEALGRGLDERRARQEAEAEARRQQVRDLVFFGGTRLPGIQVEARAATPIRVDEPTSIEFSQQKIRELEQAGQAAAVARLLRTGEMKEYEAAVKASQEAVNRLVLAEMERLRAAGVEERVINQLAGSYQVLRKEQDAAAEAARRRIEDSARVFKLIEGLGVERESQVPSGQLEQIRRLAAVTEEIKRLQDDLTRAGGSLTAEAAGLAGRRLDALERERTELEGKLEGFRQQVAKLAEPVATELAAIPTRVAPAFSALEKGALRPLTLALEEIREAMSGVTAAELELGAARAANDPARVLAAEERLASVKARLKSLTTDAAAALAEAGLGAEAYEQAVSVLASAFERLGIEIPNTTEALADFDTYAQGIETLGRGVLSAADAMGILSDEARQAVTGILDVVRGLQQVKAASALSGVAGTLGTIAGIGGIVGGLVGIGAALFGGGGGGDREERQREAQRELIQALVDLRLSIRDMLSEMGPLQSSVQEVVDGVLSQFRRAVPRGELPEEITTLPAARERIARRQAFVQEQIGRTTGTARLDFQREAKELEQLQRDIDAFLERLTRSVNRDIDLRIAAAQGYDFELSRRELNHKQAAELRDAELAGLDEATLKRYEYLHALEQEALDLAEARAAEDARLELLDLRAEQSGSREDTIAAATARANAEKDREIERYQKLRDQGIITQQEFDELAALLQGRVARAVQTAAEAFDEAAEAAGRAAVQGRHAFNELLATVTGDDLALGRAQVQRQADDWRHQLQDFFEQGIISFEELRDAFGLIDKWVEEQLLAIDTPDPDKEAAAAGDLERRGREVSDVTTRSLQAVTSAQAHLLVDIERAQLVVQRESLEFLRAIAAQGGMRFPVPGPGGGSGAGGVNINGPLFQVAPGAVQVTGNADLAMVEEAGGRFGAGAAREFDRHIASQYFRQRQATGDLSRMG